MDKMTEKQKKLVEDNIKFATYMAAKLYHPHIELDDAIQIASIGLCKAAMSYDESMGYKFISYAGRIITNELYMEERKFKSEKYVRTWVSYYNYIKDFENDTFKDLLSEDTVEFYMAIISINQLRSSLSKKDVEILDRCVIASERQASVAKDLDMSQSYVSRRAKLLRNKAKKALCEEGVI